MLSKGLVIPIISIPLPGELVTDQDSEESIREEIRLI